MDTSGEGFVCPVCGPAPHVDATGGRVGCGVCTRTFTYDETFAAAAAWRRRSPALQVSSRGWSSVALGDRAEPDEPRRDLDDPVLVVVIARSAVLAALLSLVWPGIGHLHARRAPAAIAFAVAGMVLWAGLPLLVTLPVAATGWAALVAVAALSSARAARTAPGAVYRD